MPRCVCRRTLRLRRTLVRRNSSSRRGTRPFRTCSFTNTHPLKQMLTSARRRPSSERLFEVNPSFLKSSPFPGRYCGTFEDVLADHPEAGRVANVVGDHHARVQRLEVEHQHRVHEDLLRRLVQVGLEVQRRLSRGLLDARGQQQEALPAGGPRETRLDFVLGPF